MKIAFVANTCWNIFNFRKGLVDHFQKKGFEVIVLAPRDEYSELLASWGIKWIETKLKGTGKNPIADLLYSRTLYRHLKIYKPDVILGFTIKSNIYSCLAGKFANIPVICNVSGLGTTFLVKGFTGAIAMMLYNVAFKYAGHIFFQNEDDRVLFLSKVKVDQRKVSVLPGSGINLEQFKCEQSQPKKPVKFLMVSRLIIEKGIREFAEAARCFIGNNQVKFSLIGKLDDGHSRAVSKSEVDKWVEEGALIYYKHTDDIINVIRQHEVIVLPSYREGVSRTLLEGAAMGKALLASDVPGCREVVKDGYNGFLFEAKNPKSLADKINLYLALNDDEKKQMSMNSRVLVELKFDENYVIGKYEAVIHRMIYPSN